MIALAVAAGCGSASRIADVTAALPAVSFAASSWGDPVNAGVPINSTASELQLGVAPNGRSLYVSSDRPGTLGGQDLWVAQRQSDGRWGPLVNLGAGVNSDALDSSPTLSLDGHWLYFSSRRPGGLGGLDCWRSYRADPDDDFSWQSPENLGAPVNSVYDDADCLPRRAEDGHETLWFTSFNRPGGQGDWDIYTSEIGRDGSFGPAAPVVELNTPYRDTRMTLTGDGLTVIFTSNRPGGLGGIDLWMAERATPNTPFCTPVNLGPGVNSVANDRSPSITTTGSDLYFTSTRVGGQGSDDVYLTTRLGGLGPRGCSPSGGTP